MNRMQSISMKFLFHFSIPWLGIINRSLVFRKPINLNTVTSIGIFLMSQKKNLKKWFKNFTNLDTSKFLNR